ncbi:hypothetical protein [Amycolatopsis sp. H20-H5]|uniref:hypothetical protein n=1 Tax=Amycolatopsis sp. H20-H5 TaxID=3046309 RepID=UPI002DB5A61A|nr:hypothetical protein [Amycolatopsis sp. H20-H5]MEC3979958.1 hypothetical protein [Amycolatopsis sp. H20-H5]
MTEQPATSFASALHGAILARGLTLERLVHRLAERGFTLSTATLSYWSRGRSRPERPESLAALSALEEILEVPGDSLRGRLVGRVRRGRAGPGHAVPLTELWGTAAEDVDDMIAQVGLPPEHRRVLSFHERYELDANGTELFCRVIIVLEATSGNADQMMLVFRDDAGGSSLPSIIPVNGVRLGRVGRDESTHVLVAQLWFEQSLVKGERTVAEYELEFGPGGKRSLMCERRFTAPIRQYVLEIGFDPAAVPVRFRAADEPADAEHTDRPLSADGTNTVRQIWLDRPPGIYRIDWEWD